MLDIVINSAIIKADRRDEMNNKKLLLDIEKEKYIIETLHDIEKDFEELNKKLDEILSKL